MQKVLESQLQSPLVRTLSVIPGNSSQFTYNIPDNVPPLNIEKVEIECYSNTNPQTNYCGKLLFRVPPKGALCKLALRYDFEINGQIDMNKSCGYDGLVSATLKNNSRPVETLYGRELFARSIYDNTVDGQRRLALCQPWHTGGMTCRGGMKNRFTVLDSQSGTWNRVGQTARDLVFNNIDWGGVEDLGGGMEILPVLWYDSPPADSTTNAINTAITNVNTKAKQTAAAAFPRQSSFVTSFAELPFSSMTSPSKNFNTMQCAPMEVEVQLGQDSDFYQWVRKVRPVGYDWNLPAFVHVDMNTAGPCDLADVFNIENGHVTGTKRSFTYGLTKYNAQIPLGSIASVGTYQEDIQTSCKLTKVTLVAYFMHFPDQTEKEIFDTNFGSPQPALILHQDTIPEALSVPFDQTGKTVIEINNKTFIYGMTVMVCRESSFSYLDWDETTITTYTGAVGGGQALPVGTNALYGPKMNNAQGDVLIDGVAHPFMQLLDINNNDIGAEVAINMQPLNNVRVNDPALHPWFRMNADGMIDGEKPTIRSKFEFAPIKRILLETDNAVIYESKSEPEALLLDKSTYGYYSGDMSSYQQPITLMDGSPINTMFPEVNSGCARINFGLSQSASFNTGGLALQCLNNVKLTIETVSPTAGNDFKAYVYLHHHCLNQIDPSTGVVIRAVDA